MHIAIRHEYLFDFIEIDNIILQNLYIFLVYIVTNNWTFYPSLEHIFDESLSSQRVMI